MLRTIDRIYERIDTKRDRGLSRGWGAAGWVFGTARKLSRALGDHRSGTSKWRRKRRVAQELRDRPSDRDVDLVERVCGAAGAGGRAAVAAHAGRSRVVAGEAGIGKTSLLKTLRGAARPRVALVGRCDACRPRTHLLPLHDIARSSDVGFAVARRRWQPRRDCSRPCFGRTPATAVIRFCSSSRTRIGPTMRRWIFSSSRPAHRSSALPTGHLISRR